MGNEMVRNVVSKKDPVTLVWEVLARCMGPALARMFLPLTASMSDAKEICGTLRYFTLKYAQTQARSQSCSLWLGSERGLPFRGLIREMNDALELVLGVSRASDFRVPFVTQDRLMALLYVHRNMVEGAVVVELLSEEPSRYVQRRMAEVQEALHAEIVAQEALRRREEAEARATAERVESERKRNEKLNQAELKKKRRDEENQQAASLLGEKMKRLGGSEILIMTIMPMIIAGTPLRDIAKRQVRQGNRDFARILFQVLGDSDPDADVAAAEAQIEAERSRWSAFPDGASRREPTAEEAARANRASPKNLGKKGSVKTNDGKKSSGTGKGKRKKK